MSYERMWVKGLRVWTDGSTQHGQPEKARLCLELWVRGIKQRLLHQPCEVIGRAKSENRPVSHFRPQRVSRKGEWFQSLAG